MRTTVNLDSQLISTAKRLAAVRAVTLGDIISELANKGLEAQGRAQEKHAVKRKSGFPVFKVPGGTPMIGLDDVKRDED